MQEEFFSISEAPKVSSQAKIRVIGVGGGGGNMVNYMINQGFQEIELLAANTDAQALNSSLAEIKLQLGEKLTRGLGAGMKPEKGKQAAEESYDEVVEHLQGSDLVFIATGLGGGTGTGASSIIAKAAKEVGALTIAVCTKPFSFEGPKRAKMANIGYDQLKEQSDCMILIPNDKILATIDKNMGYTESFKLVDDILAKAVHGISTIVLGSSKESGINIDFADLQTVMGHKGLALMGIGAASGPSAAYDAIKQAIESPLLDNVDIHGAMGILVNFQIHPDFPFVAITESMNIIYENLDEEADVFFGTVVDDAMQVDEVKVTLVATGFEKNSANNTPKKTQKSETIQKVALRIPSEKLKLKVASGQDMNIDGALDIPSYIRNGMD